jgi:hypothetical protein
MSNTSTAQAAGEWDPDLERALTTHAMRALAEERERRFADLERLAELNAALERTRAELAAVHHRIDELTAMTSAMITVGPIALRVAGSRRWRRVTQAWRRTSDARLLRTSPLFDAAWYLAAYPDVARAGVNPARHYLDHGAAEGRDPSASFSTRAYLAAHPELAATGSNPLVHHLRRQRAAR